MYHLHSEPNFYVFNIEEIRFEYSLIIHWHSHVLNGASNVQALIIKNSRLHYIHRYAIHNSNILCLKFTNSHIKTIAENAFFKNDFNKVEFLHSQIGKMGTGIFNKSQITQLLLLQSITLHSADSKVFAESNIEQLEISNSNFKIFLEQAFENSNVRFYSIFKQIF